MRILSVICAIIVLALNMVPCADAHEHLVDQDVSISAASTNVEHNIPVDDACTPFCHCTCCASTIVAKISTALQTPFIIKSKVKTDYFEENSIEVSLSVWQPPKLV